MSTKAQLLAQLEELRGELEFHARRRPTAHPPHPDCPVCALGFCRVHYALWKRTGSTSLRKREG